MRCVRRFAVLWLALLSMACQDPAIDLTEPASFSGHHVTFSHPRVWSVETRDVGDGWSVIFVEGGGSELHTVVVMPEDEFDGITAFAEGHAAEMSAQIPVGEVSESTWGDVESADVDGPPGGQSLGEQFSITLMGQEVPHVRIYFSAPGTGRVAMLISQASTDEIERVLPGFDLIVSTFTIE